MTITSPPSNRQRRPGPRTSENVHSLEVVTYDGERFTIGVNEESQID